MLHTPKVSPKVGKTPPASTFKVSPVDAVRAARDWAPTLPPHLRPLWIVLATYHPNIFPSVETLASLTGRGKSTTSRYLAELEGYGAITTRRTGGGASSQAHRTLVLPELGTSPRDELPDWVLAATFPE